MAKLGMLKHTLLYDGGSRHHVQVLLPLYFNLVLKKSWINSDRLTLSCRALIAAIDASLKFDGASCEIAALSGERELLNFGMSTKVLVGC